MFVELFAFTYLFILSGLKIKKYLKINIITKLIKVVIKSLKIKKPILLLL